MTQEEFMKGMASKLPNKDAKLVVACAKGGRSAKAVEWLRSAGYKDVTDVRGGFGAWSEAGLPVEQ